MTRSNKYDNPKITQREANRRDRENNRGGGELSVQARSLINNDATLVDIVKFKALA